MEGECREAGDGSLCGPCCLSLPFSFSCYMGFPALTYLRGSGVCVNVVVKRMGAAGGAGAGGGAVGEPGDGQLLEPSALRACQGSPRDKMVICVPGS